MAGTLTMMLAPWVPYLALLFSKPLGSSPDLWVVGFLPFYPWAIGIGLINYARLVELRRLTGR